MDRKWTGNAKNCLKHDIRSSREYANKYVSERELEHHVTSPAEGHMIDKVYPWSTKSIHWRANALQRGAKHFRRTETTGRRLFWGTKISSARAVNRYILPAPLRKVKTMYLRKYM